MNILLGWKNSDLLKPLLLRGARQVGKTYAVRALGETFEGFFEINFEFDTAAAGMFDRDPNWVFRRVLLPVDFKYLYALLFTKL